MRKGVRRRIEIRLGVGVGLFGRERCRKREKGKVGSRDWIGQ